MNGDGSRLRSAETRAEPFPVWSPDGRHIVFVVRDQRRGAIYVADADGRNRRAIVRSIGYDCVWLAWSPNGRRIAFTRNEGGCDGDLAIYVVGADGSGLRRLTPGHQHLDPAWSPDGRTILYTSYWEQAPALWLMDADGTRKRRIGGRPDSGNGTATRPPAVWGPNGRSIYFVGLARDTASAVFVMNPDGTGRRRLTHTLARIHSFALSPDGRRLAVAGDPDGDDSAEWDVYVLNRDGGGLRQLTHGGGNRDPQWSPDGRRIAFTSRGDIYAMNADGNGLANLTARPGLDDAPTWAPRRTTR